MSTVIEQPRNDVPIVSDTTLLQVPNVNDDKARAEYIKKIRALRNQPSEEVVSEPVQQNVQQDVETVQPETVSTSGNEEVIEDATVTPSTPQDKKNRVRLSKEDLHEYEIPITDEDGNVTYLSYDEFDKTVGMYSKQNKRARQLAEREKEVEALKSQLLTQQQSVLQQSSNAETKIAERYQWVQNSLAFAHKHNIDEITFDDGTKKKVTQLITEKTALENAYNQVQKSKQTALQQLQEAREKYIQEQDKRLEERAPTLSKKRGDITKFLERQGFTSDEANVLAHGKAELLVLFDKAMKYENAQNSQVKEKKVGSNTKVIKQPSRLAGRGTVVNTAVSSRMQELQNKGTRATADELRELRKLQLQNR